MQVGPTDLANQLDTSYSMQAVVQMVCMRLESTDLANQLDNLIEVVLLLEHLTHSLPDVDEVRVKLVIEWLEGLHHHTAGQQAVAFTFSEYSCICIDICLYRYLHAHGYV